MHQIHFDFLSHKKVLFFIFGSLVLIVISYLIQTSFYGENIFYNTYADKLTANRIEKMYKDAQKWKWLGYLIIPIALFLKVLYNNFWLTIGRLLYEAKGSFSKNYNVCLKSEYVFIIMNLVKFFFLVSFVNVNTLTDLSYIPGSFISVFNINSNQQWLIYPLQTLNIWEILFCIVGTNMYSIQFGISKSKAAKLFCIPYLTGLFVWVLIVVFLSIQFS